MWKARAKGIQAKGSRCGQQPGAQCPPMSLVSVYHCFNGSLVLLYLFFSGNRWVKHFLKINSSSNAHFLSDNSHYLLSSNDLSHLHASYSIFSVTFGGDMTLLGL